MTNDELITKAKKDYPIGTVIKLPKGIIGNDSYTVSDNNFTWGNNDNMAVSTKEGETNSLVERGTAVYFKGNWATIVSKPEEKASEFEAGKWYKIKLYENTFFKFKSINSNGSYNTINCIDRIWVGNYVKGNTISHTSAEESAVLLTDLSEIQQYLPENHVDKFPVKTELTKKLTTADLVTGEIYQLTIYDNKWIVKFDYFKAGETFSDGSISYDNMYYKKGEWGHTDKITEVKKATEEEKQHLNACIKAGKFVTLEDSKTIKQNNVKEVIPEKGKWYEIEAFGGIKYISKYGDNLKFSEFICGNNYNESGEFQDVKVIRELKSEDLVIIEPLLNYAKKKYPVGCKFMAARGSGSKYTVESLDKFTWYDSKNICIKLHGNGTIYSNGKWAEIVSLPKEKVVEKTSDTYPTDVVYQTGDRVRILRTAKSHERGWYNTWVSPKGDFIEQIFTVTNDCGDKGVSLKEAGDYLYPHFVLEKVVAEDFLDNDMRKDAIVESNLEKANRLFKVGMTIKSVMNSTFTFSESSFPLIERACGIITNNEGCKHLYNPEKNKWATIVSTPQEEWINIFNKTEWMKATIKYDEPIEWKTQSRKTSSSDLISFDDEDVIFSRPKRISSIKTQLLVVEE